MRDSLQGRKSKFNTVASNVVYKWISDSITYRLSKNILVIPINWINEIWRSFYATPYFIIYSCFTKNNLQQFFFSQSIDEHTTLFL